MSDDSNEEILEDASKDLQRALNEPHSPAEDAICDALLGIVEVLKRIS